jgi:ribose 1,5-bisphosphokinase
MRDSPLRGVQANAKLRPVNAGTLMLVLVVGPSGAGKDTLLDAARRALADDPRFRFVRRIITRPADAGGEAHEAVTVEEFMRRDYALQWQAHRLRYGIPAEAIEAGRVVVANVSRTIIAEAASRFTVRVIEVTAPAETLAARLGARGREDIADVAARLARQVTLPAHVPVETVMNDSSLEAGVARFLAALNRAASAAVG